MQALAMQRFFPYPDAIPPSKKKQAPPPNPQQNPFLDRSLVGERSEGLGRVVGEGDCLGVAGTGGLALDRDGDTVGLGLLLGLGVGLDPLEEVLTGSRGLDVLDSDVDSLLEVSVLDLLVDNDANSGLGDVVDDTSLAVVHLVGHTVFDCQLFCSIVRVTPSAQSRNSRICRKVVRAFAYPFWTAPFALTSTISPTLPNRSVSCRCRSVRSVLALTGTVGDRCSGRSCPSCGSPG